MSRDPLSEALDIESISNASYLEKIHIDELELLDKIPPCMSDDTRKILSEHWKNYWKNKEYPKEIREKISKSLKGRKFSKEHLKRKSDAAKKPVEINGKVYDSGRTAAKDLNVSPACIVKWLKNGKASYSKY